MTRGETKDARTRARMAAAEQAAAGLRATADARWREARAAATETEAIAIGAEATEIEAAALAAEARAKAERRSGEQTLARREANRAEWRAAKAAARVAE